MALKLFLIFTLCFSQYALSQSSSKKRSKRSSSVIQSAAKLHKNKQFTKSNQLLQKKYNFKNLRKTPTIAYYLSGQNYFKLKKYRRSITFFNLMIKKKYIKPHILTLKALKKDEIDEDNIPKILKQAYYFMGLAYYKLYLKKNTPALLSKTKRYLKICNDVDFSDTCNEILDLIVTKEQNLELQKNRYEFFVYGGRLLHQDSFILSSDTTSEEIEVLSNNASICYGGGLRLTNAFRGYEASGCVYSGNSTVKSQGGSKSYKQSGVPIAGFISEFGYFWKPDNDKTRLGISASVLYKSALYTEPDGFSIDEMKKTSFGYVLTAGHELSLFELQVKLGRYGTQSTFSLNTAINY